MAQNVELADRPRSGGWRQAGVRRGLFGIQALKQKAMEAPKELQKLNAEYREYIEGINRKWTAENRMRSNRVYETMYKEEREEVHRRIAQWGRYITPIAEAWWAERGYGCIWPDDDSEPMKLYVLEPAGGNSDPA